MTMNSLYDYHIFQWLKTLSGYIEQGKSGGKPRPKGKREQRAHHFECWHRQYPQLEYLPTITLEEYMAAPKVMCTDGVARYPTATFPIPKSLRSEYRDQFDEWCRENDVPVYDHDNSYFYLSYSGQTAEGWRVQFFPPSKTRETKIELANGSTITATKTPENAIRGFDDPEVS